MGYILQALSVADILIKGYCRLCRSRGCGGKKDYSLLCTVVRGLLYIEEQGRLRAPGDGGGRKII